MINTTSGNKYVDPLRASNEDVAAAMNDLLQQQENSDLGEEEDPRYQFDSKITLQVELRQPGGSTSRLLVRPQYMSKKGMGFLNGGFVYPGSTCRMQLDTLDGEKLRVNGTVRHCQCVRGKVHCVGVQFDSEVDPAYFIKAAVPVKPQEIQETNDPDAVVRLSQKLRKMALLNLPLDEQHDLYREIGAALGLP
ncbi:MAG: hypothetical protein GXP29_14265 [Planctomycetes bacterium]|nr:hypothetical protein [Planctomycetota bacterium]